MGKSMAERAREARERREDREERTGVTVEADNIETLIVANDESLEKIVKGAGGGSGDEGIKRLTSLINDENLSVTEFIQEAKKSILYYVRLYGNTYHKNVEVLVPTDYSKLSTKIVDEVSIINESVREMMKDKNGRFNIEAEIARMVATSKILNQVASSSILGA